VIDTMRGFGVASPIPRHVSISLGTPDLTLLEVAAGYAGIASGGRRVEPRMYDLVTNPAGAIVDDLRVRPPGPQVISPLVLMRRAGTPAMTEYGVTDFVTTLPAPTTLPSPIVTPSTRMLPEPIQQSSWTIIP
jgi:hypothetical protein